MRRSSRGFLLIVALTLTTVMLIMGMSYMSQRVLQYQGAAQDVLGAQARAIAEAGMEDARAKLQEDYAFPPFGNFEQTVYSYTEFFYDLDGTTKLGTYTVSIDRTYVSSPYQILTIISVGRLASGMSWSITAEVDVAKYLRSSSTTANAAYYNWINWREAGSI